MGDDKKKSILDKIKKLLRMSDESGNASEQERETALRHANSIMSKHNLTMDDVEESEVNRGYDEFGTSMPWKASVAQAMAKLYGCKVYRSPSIKKIVIVGAEHNRVVAKSMYVYCINSIHREVEGLEDKSRSAVNSFKKGAGSGLNIQVNRIIKEREEGQQEDISVGQAMVLKSYYEREAGMNDAYIKDDMGVKLTTTKQKVSDYKAYVSGQNFGKNVSLNSQVKGQGQRRLT